MQTRGQSERLLADLASLDKNVRMAAVIGIGEAADVAMLPALLDRLAAEPDFFVRDNVIWAIVRMGDAAVEPVIALLVLGSFGGDAASGALASALRDAEWEVRFAAVNALGTFSDATARAAIAHAVDDAHPHVRYLAGRLKTS